MKHINYGTRKLYYLEVINTHFVTIFCWYLLLKHTSVSINYPIDCGHIFIQGMCNT